MVHESRESTPDTLVLQAVGARLWTAAVLIDSAGQLTYANPAAGRLVQRQPSELIGRRFDAFVHRDDRERMRDLFDRICNGIPVDGPIPLRVCTRHDNIRHVEVLATDLRDQRDIHAVMVTIRDLSRRMAADAELQHHATHDELTGLLNRAGVRDRAADLSLVREWLSVIFVSVTGLDRINDAYGRDHADRATGLLASRLEAAAGDNIIGCVGSGEFVVVAGATNGSASALVRSLEQAVDECPSLLGVQCKLNVTIGITAIRRGHVTVDDAIRDAATAAHHARTRTGHRVQAFNNDMRNSMKARMQLECELADALLDDTIEVGFQPIVALATGERSGAEGLLRWTPPDGRHLSVTHVVEVAEEVGLIVPIGVRTLHRVLDAAAGPSVRASGLVLSVNLSARQLVEPDFVDVVRQGLERSGADPRSIAFELTETAIMTDSTLSCRTLSELRALGCWIGIDDFGTGWSSLSRIRDLPIDFVKIDHAFISELDGSGRTEPVVAAIVGIATAFGISTIAEGIETVEQARIATELGCDYGQGYLFGRAELRPGWLDLAG